MIALAVFSRRGPPKQKYGLVPGANSVMGQSM